jgi:glycosyltransferase involved in cell wall biosynthesis
MKKNAFERVIINAPDSNIFNPTGKLAASESRKVRLIGTSWSANWNKGFDIYEFLDENLDFNRYEMTFVGRSPVEFKNIKLIDPLPSDQLASELKQHDLFITASKFDPCSNSLLEALACGLPALVRNSGGHPEIIERGGLVFDGIDDVLKKLDALSSDIQNHQNLIPQRNISEAADHYHSFVSRIFEKVRQNQYIPKKLGLIKTLLIKL